MLEFAMLSAEKRNVLLLAAAQALFQTVPVMVLTTSGVVGLQLAPHASLATLPLAMMTVATTATMIPASLLMQRFGRKAGFALGASLGGAAGLVAAVAISSHNFWLFVLANVLAGAYSGFAQYYRFAAADASSDEFRSRAISWVVAGGIVAAVAGPNLVRLTEHWGTTPFVATYLVPIALSLAALAVISRLSLPPLAVSKAHGPARPLGEIIAQPVYLTALLSATVGFAVMTMVMTATPLAMLMCGHSMGASATVIQWHVLGMFVPSFFTGALIRRIGVLAVMGCGIALLAAHVAVAFTGIDFLQFVSGLTLLGIGWNFLFIGGTTLLTETYRPAERAKAQAAHDFLMFTIVSLASFSAGGVMNAWGWTAVNLTVLPFLALAAVAVGVLAIGRARAQAGAR
jgi:MFS family permease